MASGGGAAYVRLTKPEDGLSQSAQFWGNLYAQQREQEANRQEKSKVRAEEAAAKEREEFNKRWQVDLEKFKYDDTGDPVGDKVLSEGVLTMKNQYIDLVNQEAELRNAGKSKEADQKMMDGKILLNSLNKINNLRGAVATSFEEYNKALADGLVDQELSSNYESRMVKILEGKYSLRYDPEKKDVLAVGANEDGTGFTQYGEDLLNGKFRWYKKADASTLSKGIAAALPEKVYDELGKDTITTVKSFDDPNGEIAQATRTMIASQLSKDPDYYKSLLNFYSNGEIKKTTEELTPEEIQFVEDSLFSDVRAMYSTEEKVKEATDRANLQLKKDKFNWDKYVDQQTIAQRWEQVKNDKNADAQGYAKGELVLQDGRKAVSYSPNGGFSIETMGNDLFGATSVVKSNYNTVVITDDGKMYYTNGTGLTPVDETQKTNVANKLGFGDTGILNMDVNNSFRRMKSDEDEEDDGQSR